MLFCCVKFSISQLFCCVKFKYHLSSRKWQAQLCLIQLVLCELMLLDMSYLCKFSMDYIGSLVELKQLQLDRLAFKLHVFLAFDMSLDRVSQYKDYEGDGWFWLRFFIGLVVFLGGIGVNILSDRVLMALKKEGKGYRVPRGGLFELVSCPNYFGEDYPKGRKAVIPFLY